MKVIVLNKNTPTEVTFFLYPKLGANYATPYYSIVLESDMAGENQAYSFSNITDISLYPQVYSTFVLTAGLSWLAGDYNYYIGNLLDPGDPPTNIIGFPIEYGKMRILDSVTEVVFDTDEIKNQKVFDED